MVRRLALLVLVSLFPTLALAQPGRTEPVAPRAPEPAKSATTARVAALATTAAGFGLMYLAVERDTPPLATAGLVTMIVGPSAGHVYAGESKHALGMSALRLGGLVVFGLGALSVANDAGECFETNCSSQRRVTGGHVAMAAGGLIVLGSAIYDIYDAGRAAERTNAKHAASIRLAPTMVSANGRSLPAIALGGTF